MSLFRRAGTNVLRSLQTRGGHGWPGGSFWAQGSQTGRNGYLFGETPPPPGESRKWESWEAMWYGTLAIGTAGALLILYGKPDTSIQTWARPFAAKELEEEDKLFQKYAEEEDFRTDMTAKIEALGHHRDEYYDIIMMRYEYDILKFAHKFKASQTGSA